MIQSNRFFAALALLACISLAACGGSSTAIIGTTAPTGIGSVSSTVASTKTTVTYGISGVVSGISDVSVVLSGASSNTSSTDSGGNFEFAKLAPGNYTISPSKTGYVFSPVSLAETVTSASLTDVNFAATASTAATYTISGTVSGSVAAGVTITLNGTNVGSAVTDLSGNYTFVGLVSGTYTVSASLGGYSFTGPLIVSLGTVDSASNNFTSATAAAGGSLAFIQVNPLPEATVGAAYSSSVVEGISGGTAPPYYYQSDTLATGTPPHGMIVNPNGNLTGTPTVAGQYNFSVCATDSAGEKSPCEATSITVVDAPSGQPTPAPTVVLAASPSKIVSGSTSELVWTSKNATACSAGGGWAGTKAISGKASIAPKRTTTVTLTCTGAGGSALATAVITVTPAPTPPTPAVTLTATHTTIPSGSTSTLKWSSKNVTACARSGGWTGTEAVSGSLVVSPMSTTTYILACTNSAGTAQSATKITVHSAAPPPAPTATLKAGASSITSGGSTTLTWSSTNASSCTASGGWTGTEAANGTKSVSPAATTTYTLDCTGSGGKAQVSTAVKVNGSGTPPAAGTSWVYFNGLFDWPGDYSFVAKADYHDKTGVPMSGKEDVKVTLQGAYGGWLPYAQNWSFNSAPYTKLTFSLKPTVANQQWSVYFVKVGDIPVGISVDVRQYGPTPVVGEWNTYTVPLAHLGVLGTTIYKFAIQDKTGLSNNTWYVDNVGFVP